MNKLHRLLSLGVVAAGLLVLPSRVFATSYFTSGTTSIPLVSQNWTVWVPSSVTMSSTATASISGGQAYGGASVSVSRTSSPSASIYAFSASGPAGSTYTNSASASNQPSGTYYIYHSYGVSGGPDGSTSATLWTTLTW